MAAGGEVGDLPLAPGLGDVVALSEGRDHAGRDGGGQGGGGSEEGRGTHFVVCED